MVKLATLKAVLRQYTQVIGRRRLDRWHIMTIAELCNAIVMLAIESRERRIQHRIGLHIILTLV